MGKEESIIEKYIYKIKRTRRNRINYSERLKAYSKRWKIIAFIFNVEAILLIILSLNIDDKIITLTSATFAIYVILLQYFINELNYNERSIRSHYHQLELRDLLLKLEMLNVKYQQNDQTENDTLGEVEDIMKSYQMSLKNNENHDKIDDIINVNRKKGYKKHDNSLDNVFIWFNYGLCIFMLIFFGVYLFIGGPLI